MQCSACVDRADANRVVQPVDSIEAPPVRSYQNLRCKARSSKAERQYGDCLLCGKTAAQGIIVEESNRRGLFLKRIQPTTIGMKCEMSWAIAAGKRDNRSAGRGGQLSGCRIELVNVDPVLAQIGCKDKSIHWIGSNHMRVRGVVTADGEAPCGRIGRVHSTN